MSKLFEIQKQVLFSDLSNDELELLIKTVAEKRAKNSGKGKSTAPQSFEDSMFLRCCRENRNFTTVNDAGKVVCPCCRSAEIIKFGKSKNGRQRYKCKSCGKVFSDTYGTVAFRSKLPIEKWISLIQYTLMGISCRKTAKNIGVNKDTVLYNRHRICSVIKQLAENKDSFPSMAEGDEFYYPLSFKDKKNPNFFIEVLGRMPYTHRSMEKKYEYVVNAGYDEVTKILHQSIVSDFVNDNKYPNIVYSDYEEVSKYYQLCDFFVMPSHFEAYGIVLVEALQNGLPCIARNAFAMKEIIQDGNDGLLLKKEKPEELAQLMEEMYLHSDVYVDFVRNNKRKYELEYSWASVAEKILEVIRQDEEKNSL